MQPVDELLAVLKSQIQALEKSSSRQQIDDIIGALTRMGEIAKDKHQSNGQQQLLSMVAFVDAIKTSQLTQNDCQQLLLLLETLQNELQGQRAKRILARLKPAIWPPTPTTHRIAIYIEHTGVAAVLMQRLSELGFHCYSLPNLYSLIDDEVCHWPTALISDLSLCEQQHEASAIIHQFKRDTSHLHQVILLLDSDDMASRLQALRLGACRMVKKSLNVDSVISALQALSIKGQSQRFRVLFIDDARVQLVLYKAVMEKVGVEVRVIADPLQALEAIEEFQPDVVVTDLYMQGCSGQELATLLRQDESFADTALLFLSSETDLERQIEALNLGGDDFLLKPVRDIVLQRTILARAQRARDLKRSRREYKRITERLERIEFAIDKHSIVSVADIAGNIVYVNERFCDISGYSADELLGQTHRIVKSNQHLPAFYQTIWSTITQGRTWHGEICNRRKDGSYYWVDATITPQLNEFGLPDRYISVRTDITPLKEMQEQLFVAKVEAEAASQTKSVFLAHISHELKTPLNSIIGFTQLMKNNPDSPVNLEQVEMLEVIERGGHHLLALINDLVDLAKIDTGHMGLTMLPIRLGPLIRECIGLLRPQIAARGLTLVFDDSHIRQEIFADRIRVKQVLLNFLSNAVKYNQDGGTIEVGCIVDRQQCRTYVRDSGPGIDEQDLAALFQPFSRLRKTAHTTEGSGIGLAVSKNLIERMNGEIGVISQLGQGSEFWFALPMS